jgi:hypothetical protein
MYCTLYQKQPRCIYTPPKPTPVYVYTTQFLTTNFEPKHTKHATVLQIRVCVCVFVCVYVCVFV